jgi:protein PhnA
MSKGFQGKFHRQNMLSRFAKDLVRRSRSHCELCDRSGVKLDVYELSPLGEEPYVDGCIFICDGCRKQIVEPKKMTPGHWRCLNNALYSEVTAVQVMSFRLLKRLAAKAEHWAEELLEHAYLEPDAEHWAELAE